jgi:hypothetical protein
VPLSEYE